MKTRCLTGAIIFACCAVVAAQDKIVYHVLIDGPINARVPPMVHRIIQEAEEAHAHAIILEINTFGGDMEAATQIRDDILDTKIFTIAFVNKRAISAGALIALAAGKLVMAPGATIGAATPVTFSGEQASEKVISYWRKEMKATAESTHRPAQIAEAMVDEAVEIPGLSERGKLLTLTTNEALHHDVADYRLGSIDAVLESFDLMDAQVVSTSTTMVSLLRRPALIWFLIGFLLLIVEFVIPGLVIFFFGIGAWIVALICLLTSVSLNAQLVLFLVASLLLLVLLRQWVKTVFMGRIASKEGGAEVSEEFIGKQAIVIKTITPIRKGRVYFQGSHWDAESHDTIPEGCSVEIIQTDNITLQVKRL